MGLPSTSVSAAPSSFVTETDRDSKRERARERGRIEHPLTLCQLSPPSSPKKDFVTERERENTKKAVEQSYDEGKREQFVFACGHAAAGPCDSACFCRGRGLRDLGEALLRRNQARRQVVSEGSQSQPP